MIHRSASAKTTTAPRNFIKETFAPMFHLVGILQGWSGVRSLSSVTVGNKNIRRTSILEFWSLPIECVRSWDQKPYLHNETKGGICIKTEFNPQKNSSLLQDGRRFSVYSSKMAAVTSCEHTKELTQPRLRRQQERHKFAYLLVKNIVLHALHVQVSFLTFRRRSRSFYDVK